MGTSLFKGKCEEMTCPGLDRCRKNISESHYNHVCLSDNYCDDWEHSGDVININLAHPAVWRSYYAMAEEIAKEDEVRSSEGTTNNG